jgi:hypothetical protein
MRWDLSMRFLGVDAVRSRPASRACRWTRVIDRPSRRSGRLDSNQRPPAPKLTCGSRRVQAELNTTRRFPRKPPDSATLLRQMPASPLRLRLMPAIARESAMARTRCYATTRSGAPGTGSRRGIDETPPDRHSPNGMMASWPGNPCGMRGILRASSQGRSQEV